MSAPHDLVEDYDMDTVSLMSAVEDEQEGLYFNAECIIAENLDDEEEYLVKWEDYPLHRCTWEPPEHLDGTNLLSEWKRLKEELGEAALQRENERNCKAYAEAIKRVEAVKKRKDAKCAKKRKKLQRRDRRVIFDDDSSEEEPLATSRRGRSLFVDEGQPVSGSPDKSPTDARLSPVPRKAPLQQSSSQEESSSEVHDSGDFLMGELQRENRMTRKADRRAARSPLRTSLLHNKKAESTTSVRTSKTAAAAERGPQRLKVSAVTTKSAFPTVSEKDKTVVTTATISNPTESTVSKGGGKAIHTAPSKQTNRAINFSDQPKEQQRTGWLTDNHYNKLKYRGLAEKRSRTEGTPDFNALTFVNGPPPTLSKAATKSGGDPYSRRDIANRRIQEEENPDDRSQLGQDAGPLADWEKDKLPLICSACKLSSNCAFGAQKCRFMHRTYDPQGQPYQLGDINNWIPPKYRKSPITCKFWCNGNRCKKTPEECTYAHEDTGWTEINGKPIEREHLPPTIAEATIRDAPPHFIPFKLRNPPITCSFWLQAPQGCSKTEAACKCAHWNTGWAHPEHDIKAPAVPIDPNLRPRRVPSKYADPPVTCPFWLRSESGCTRTDEECEYAHWNTGWAPSGLENGQPLPIDSSMQSRSQSYLSTGQDQSTDSGMILPSSQGQANKDLTCSAWLRELQGCPKSEDACDYLHRNTGRAISKNRPFDRTIPLDPNQIPRFQRNHNGSVRSNVFDVPAPKNADPSITCFFWLNHPEGCSYSAADCSFAHRNTGWTRPRGSGQNPKPKQINPREMPRFRKYDPTDDSSMQNGHTGPSSRIGSLNFASEPGFDIADHMLPTFSREVVQSPVAIDDFSRSQLPATITSVQLNAKIEQLYNMNIMDMFNSGVPDDDTMLEHRAMLLYHPQEHTEDIELVTRWLLMHDVQVSNLWYDGAWTQFHQDMSEGKSGIIIAHPDFERFVELPGFGEVLKQRTRVWSVGLQPPAEYEFGVSPDPPELQHACIGIFPHGGFVYITDDVFEQKPQLALSIVKLFFAKIEQLRSLGGPVSPWLEISDACLLWRLCVRPELTEALYRKCEDNSVKLAAQNSDYMSRAELYQLLTLTNYIEQDHPIEPRSLVEDKYPIISERRVVAEHPPLDYFNRLANSQEDANTHMIGYYAAMQSADMRRAYRYFYVVHTDSEAACAKEWKASIHNIAEIITPEQCIEELSKPSKESLFDFLDWAMGPKEGEAELESEGEEELRDAAMEMSSPRAKISTVPAA
ncbi:uncharacterized protein M421DRAFT_422636 [Didymella exigua CBS 183.55]|uniref:Chromo domain-containing protein n=1 Tax=Didymella exigua CBS 183.55 TaxID=1150837 RepID=A0A6A5RHU1_9PLEO|nr:uncharacterized protein M421DRAFT_422636 [Didymella exigua CBS 183.55]KAF1926664.1 hypothetical protein M421DRAFT_422636 [Didymella exigua CBS 183.55]